MELWDRQEGETVNQYCWFKEYLLHNDYSLKNFYEKLTTNTLESNSKSQKNKKIPTYNSIKKWSSCNNWTKRKKAYSIYKVEQQTHRLEEADYKNKERIHQKKNLLITKALEKVEEEFNNGTLSGYQWSNWVNGISKLLDDNRIDTGSPTEITKSEINAEVSAETEVKHKSVFEEIEELKRELKDLE